MLDEETQTDGGVNFGVAQNGNCLLYLLVEVVLANQLLFQVLLEAHDADIIGEFLNEKLS